MGNIEGCPPVAHGENRGLSSVRSAKQIGRKYGDPLGTYRKKHGKMYGNAQGMDGVTDEQTHRGTHSQCPGSCC